MATKPVPSRTFSIVYYRNRLLRTRAWQFALTLRQPEPSMHREGYVSAADFESLIAECRTVATRITSDGRIGWKSYGV